VHAPPPPSRIEFHLSAAQGAAAFDTWHGALRDLFDVKLVGEHAASAFRGDVTGFHLGDSLTFDNASVAQRLVRTPALARRSAVDHVMIQYQTSGHLRGDYDGRSIELRAGDIGFVDFARPTASCETDFSRITLIVPRERLPAAFRRRDLHGEVLDGSWAPTRLFGRYLKALWQAAPSLTPAQAAAGIDAAFALAGSAWMPRRIEPDQQAAIAPALRQMGLSYIDSHFSGPGLTPRAVAAALGLSRSSLYRLFEPDGGVQAAIRVRRLEGCFAALVDQRRQGKAIGAIAFANGFSSEAHFSRAFHLRFGIRARDLRGIVQERAAQRGHESDLDAVRMMRDWMHTLRAHGS
jgi:AraC-like DNA-binding protein